MTPEALTEYLHSHMPLSRAMSVTVVSASADEVVAEAPLGPNVNVHGTMFGGSVATLALLAAWSVVFLRLQDEGFEGQIVVHRSATDYLRPIAGPAQAVARMQHVDWGDFTRQLARRGKARVSVMAEVRSDGEIAARLVGEFVAIGKR